MNAGNIVLPQGQDHPPRQRSQRRALGASALIVAATLASCSTGSQDPGDDTTTASSSLEQEAPSHPETQTQAETGTASANSTDEQATDPEDQDSGETGTSSGSDPEEGTETADGGTSGTAAGTAPEPTGTSTDGGLEDMVTPPGFAEPDAVLQEDAFDGPNLRLGSLTLDDASQEDIVSVSFIVEGSGFPGWQVEYVDGDSHPFGSEVQSALRVVLLGVNPDGVDTSSFPESELIEIEAGEPTDGDLTLYLGIASEPVPFRVHLQYSPLRLMVDLSTAGS